MAGTKVLKAETIEKMIQEMFTGAKAKFVPLNIERSAAAWPACSDLFQRAGEFAHRPSLFGGPCAFCAF